MAGSPEFPQVLQTQRAAGTLINTFTAATSVLNATELQTMPANYFKAGVKFHVRAYGGISNVVTATPTFTFNLMLGSVVAWTSGALTTNATANTLLPFLLDLELRVDSVGSGTTAKLIGGGLFTCAGFTLSNQVVPITAPAVGTGFDSTIANILDLKVACSASNAGNGIQLYDLTLEQKAF